MFTEIGKKNDAKIVIVGVGGAGNNTVNHMLDRGMRGNYVSVYTTLKAERNSPNYKGVPIGIKTTKNIGAGGDPEKGRLAAEENKEDIKHAIEGADMVFVTCGMGGGTGTGAAPVVAEIAKEQGILTVGIVTKPFKFEGGKRLNNAVKGINELKKVTDSFIIISNDRILEMVDRRVSMAEALRISDEVLVKAISGITDVIQSSGLINLDFADIKTAMKDKGCAFLGVGRASGEERALAAVGQALDSVLLEADIKGATDIILNISGNVDFGMFQEISEYVSGLVGDEVNMILGTCFDETSDECMVTIIATGVEYPEDKKKEYRAKNSLSKPEFRTIGAQVFRINNMFPEPGTFFRGAYVPKRTAEGVPVIPKTLSDDED